MTTTTHSTTCRVRFPAEIMKQYSPAKLKQPLMRTRLSTFLQKDFNRFVPALGLLLPGRGGESRVLRAHGGAARR